MQSRKEPDLTHLITDQDTTEHTTTPTEERNDDNLRKTMPTLQRRFALRYQAGRTVTQMFAVHKNGKPEASTRDVSSNGAISSITEPEL